MNKDLTIMTTLSFFYTLVSTAHFIENTEQGIKNTHADNCRRPQSYKNSNQLMVYPCAKNKHVNGKQYRKRCSDKIIMRLHTLSLIK